MSDFFRALPWVLEAEGGVSDHPDDRGGLTNHGVTQMVYDRYRFSQDLPKRMVTKITNDEVIDIYHTLYWKKAHCDALPWPISYVHFDAAVNHGPSAAMGILQRAVGVDDDGKFGPITKAAVEAVAPSELIDDILWERLDLYAKIVRSRPSQKKFISGWLNRVLLLRKKVT